LFGDRSVRVWTVLGGIAAVLGLMWAIHPIHLGASDAGSAGSDARAAASHPTAAPAKGSSRPSGIWIAQLASIPLTAGFSQLQQELDEIRIEIPGAQYVDSSNYASLHSGFWVVYYNGSFDNGNQALNYCASHGRTTKNQCVGRFLSSNVQDKSYICFPPADSQTAGCYHPGTTAFRTIRVRPGHGTLHRYALISAKRAFVVDWRFA
jgi:hypothetical protein